MKEDGGRAEEERDAPDQGQRLPGVCDGSQGLGGHRENDGQVPGAGELFSLKKVSSLLQFVWSNREVIKILYRQYTFPLTL